MKKKIPDIVLASLVVRDLIVSISRICVYALI